MMARLGLRFAGRKSLRETSCLYLLDRIATEYNQVEWKEEILFEEEGMRGYGAFEENEKSSALPS
jgi:hypothetical protein